MFPDISLKNRKPDFLVSGAVFGSLPQRKATVTQARQSLSFQCFCCTGVPFRPVSNRTYSTEKPASVGRHLPLHRISCSRAGTEFWAYYAPPPIRVLDYHSRSQAKLQVFFQVFLHFPKNFFEASKTAASPRKIPIFRGLRLSKKAAGRKSSISSRKKP